MKKISSLLFGLVFATAAAYSAPCLISASTSSATGCTITSGQLATTLGSTLMGSIVGGTYSFSGPPATIGASYNEYVYADPSNPFGAGDDTYILQLFNVSGTGVEHVTVNNFGPAIGASMTGVEVGYLAGGAATSTITSDGSIISFNFPTTGKLGGNETFVIYTGTTASNGTGSTGIIDGTAGSAPFIQPTLSPEPVSMSLLGGGLALLGALRLRRK